MLVNGLSAQVLITGQEAANDTLTINGQGGDDIIDASGLPAGQIKLTVDAGDGDDVVVGSAGDDVILGGNGNDVLLGAAGNDVIFGGAGDDRMTWNPGDGSDIFEGQSGNDLLTFNGSNASEIFDISANGSRVRLTRDVGNITMDLNSVEMMELRTLGGFDTVTVNDLTGTGLAVVAVDLAATPGGSSDGQADTVIINDSATATGLLITQSGQSILVHGGAADVFISGHDAGDTLQLNGLGGADDHRRLDAGGRSDLH